LPKNTTSSNRARAPAAEVHPLKSTIDGINKTHPGLGNLAAISLIAAKACKTIFVIGPPGTGKSVVINWLGRVLPESYVRGDLTMAALRKFNEELSNSQAVILIDDIGACSSDWNRVQTALALIELTYSHTMIKDTHQIKVSITGFEGAAVLGVQPNVLAELVKHTSWHSNMADKSMRYYHLIRPTHPTRDRIDQPVSWGVDFAHVLEHDGTADRWPELISAGLEQWSHARSWEHCHDLARATAALRDSYNVEPIDIDLLLELMRPMSVEMESIVKHGFGSEAFLNQNLIYLLTEFASYPTITYETFAVDYKMRPTQVRTILEGMLDWYQKIGNNPITLQPTDRLRDVLERAGIR